MADAPWAVTTLAWVLGAGLVLVLSALVVGLRQLAVLRASRAAAEQERAQERAQLLARSGALQELLHQAQQDVQRLRQARDEAQGHIQGLRETAARWQAQAQRLPELESTLAQQRQALLEHSTRNAQLQAQLLAEQEARALQHDAAQERLQLLLNAKEALSDQFKALAADTLNASTKALQEQSQNSLLALLEPLRLKMGEFQQKVEEVYVDESKERSALKSQVEQLVQLNQTLANEAKSLTSALKGSNKTQGNWGELVLERVLETSGLRRDHEYLVQDAQLSADGARQLPDVVVLLPEGRRLVVDSKASLLGYERLVNAQDEAEREQALKEHLGSVRAHLKGLSDKKYQELYGGSLDFVLMFIPVEPAFIAAVTQDPRLFMDAWERNVLLVSPSTLLFVVRTVAHLWRQEAQSKNAQDIAKRGAELYDKLHGFVQDFENVGSRLELAQQTYDQARKKLVDGKGNVIRQAEMLRSLGVKPTKVLPAALVEEASAHQDKTTGSSSAPRPAFGLPRAVGEPSLSSAPSQAASQG